MEVNLHRFREPTHCIYWDDPKPVRSTPMKELFELIDTYAHESHLRRYLLKCRECGQLYFFEFYEWVDWENGNDPQYSKYIPVSNLDEAEMLKNAETHDLLRFSPSLNSIFRKTPKWRRCIGRESFHPSLRRPRRLRLYRVLPARRRAYGAGCFHVICRKCRGVKRIAERV
jgi:hypothetical protein